MKTIFLSLSLLLMTGCAGRHTGNTSYVTPHLNNEEAIRSIAADTTSCLVALYPPGKTTLRLDTGKSKSSFSDTLEDALRARGFSILAPGSVDSHSVQVKYILDQLRTTSQTWLLRLRLNSPTENRRMMRSYTMSGQPAAGFSTIGGAQ